jgi:hypothetical protein
MFGFMEMAMNLDRRIGYVRPVQSERRRRRMRAARSAVFGSLENFQHELFWCFLVQVRHLEDSSRCSSVPIRASLAIDERETLRG